MEISDLPWYGHILFGGFTLGALGLLIMTGMPREWQNTQGWLMVSYLALPGFLVVITVVVNAPILLFGALFLLGVGAASRK